MRIDVRKPFAFIAAASAGFSAGMVTMGVIVWDSRDVAGSSPVGIEEVSSAATLISEDDDPIHELRDRDLEIPVQAVPKHQLRDSFHERRALNQHEAIDIMAPRGTPIVAVEDGTIARFFESLAGGTTLYQFDPATKYVYYYAHLERYAEGIHEHDHVQRGQVLGYVGTSGNASKDAPHLHFAIFLLTEKKQWWKGTPINPYEVFK